MHYRLLRLAMTGASLILGSTASTAQVVDQSNYVDQFHPSAASVAGGFTHFWVGQTFRPAATTSVGAGFNIRPYRPGTSGSSTLTIELWNDFPWHGGAAKLASGSTPFSLALDQIAMIDVWWASIAVTPSAMYFLAARAPDPSLSLTFTTSAYTNNYPGGSFYWNQSTSSSDSYSGNLNSDAVFQEFAATPQTTVPEPSSIALMAAGVLGIFVANRRRRGAGHKIR